MFIRSAAANSRIARRFACEPRHAASRQRFACRWAMHVKEAGASSEAPQETDNV